MNKKLLFRLNCEPNKLLCSRMFEEWNMSTDWICSCWIDSIHVSKDRIRHTTRVITSQLQFRTNSHAEIGEWVTLTTGTFQSMIFRCHTTMNETNKFSLKTFIINEKVYDKMLFVCRALGEILVHLHGVPSPWGVTSFKQTVCFCVWAIGDHFRMTEKVWWILTKHVLASLFDIDSMKRCMHAESNTLYSQRVARAANDWISDWDNQRGMCSLSLSLSLWKQFGVLFYICIRKTTIMCEFMDTCDVVRIPDESCNRFWFIHFTTWSSDNVVTIIMGSIGKVV